MTTAAIMQPTYLPWMGYFNLIHQVDTFVFLDTVQFDKRSWQQRNRVKSPGGELVLTVPVRSKGKQAQRICDVEIDNSQKFRAKHLTSIRRNYSKSAYFAQVFDQLEEHYSVEHEHLADFTITLTKWLCSQFDIQANFIRSSDLKVTGSKVDLLVDICKAVQADHYLSPAGSKVYIDENNLFEPENIKLTYQHYVHPEYEQLYGKFLSYMSALDLLFNHGSKGKVLITSGQTHP